MAWDIDSIESSFLFKGKKRFSSFVKFFLSARLYIRHCLHYHRCLGFHYIVHYEVGHCSASCVMESVLYRILLSGGYCTKFIDEEEIVSAFEEGILLTSELTRALLFL
jgi:hypothetical protein